MKIQSSAGEKDWRAEVAQRIFNKIIPLKELCQNNSAKVDDLEKIRLVVAENPPILFKINDYNSDSSFRSYFSDINYLFSKLELQSAEDIAESRLYLDSLFDHILPLFESFSEVESCKALLVMKDSNNKYFGLALNRRIESNPQSSDSQEHKVELLEQLYLAGTEIGGSNLTEKWTNIQGKFSNIEALFIDGIKQVGKDPQSWIQKYDAREPGCLKNIHQAYNISIATRPADKELALGDHALKFFLRINDCAMQWKYKGAEAIVAGAGSEEGCSVVANTLLYTENGTKLNRSELADLKRLGYPIPQGKPKKDLLLSAEDLLFLKNSEQESISGGDKMWSLCFDPVIEDIPLKFLFKRNPENALKCLSDILRIYYNAKEAEPDQFNKIKILVDTYGKLERLHITEDGNTRTSLIWVNIELMEMGYPPALMRDPNMVASRCPEAVLDQLIDGMQATCKEVGLLPPSPDEAEEIKTLNDIAQLFEGDLEHELLPPSPDEAASTLPAAGGAAVALVAELIPIE